MKPLLRFLTVCALLFTAVSSHAAPPFEGKISLAMTTGKGRPQTMDYSIKGQKIRMDLNSEGRQVATVVDLEMLILMAEQKMYLVQPIKKPFEPAAAKVGESTAEIEVTGKTETILGCTCSPVLIKDKGIGV